MRIEYHQNPLRTKVYLDEKDKEIFRLKIEQEVLFETLYSVHYHLSKSETPNIERAKDEASLVGGGDYDKYIDQLLEAYTQDLLHSHIGDCTCVPCSCSKCHAEYILGIDTIEGLGKHLAYKIDSAFSREDNAFVTIDEAIESLSIPLSEEPNEHYKTHPEMYKQYLPKWQKERISARDWLINYKKTHEPFQCTNAHLTPGSTVVFHGNSPWPDDVKRAILILEIGKEYKVSRIDAGGSLASIELEGYPYKWFSSCMFREKGNRDD